MSNNRRFVYGIDGRVFTSNNKIFDFLSGYPPFDGMALWLRADAGVVKNGNDKVSQWQDQSGNGHHLYQNTEALKPTKVIHPTYGYHCLLFNVNHMIANVIPDFGSTDLHIFCAVEGFSTAEGGRFKGIINVGSELNFWIARDMDANSHRVHTYNSNSSVFGPDFSFTPEGMRTLIGYRKNLGSLIELYQDGGIVGSSTAANATGTFTNDVINVGYNRGTSGGYWNGYIMEIIIYTRQISDPQRQSVENYLMNKYGL